MPFVWETTLSFIHPNRHLVYVRLMNLRLESVAEWAAKNKLQLNASKSQAIVFVGQMLISLVSLVLRLMVLLIYIK